MSALWMQQPQRSCISDHSVHAFWHGQVRRRGCTAHRREMDELLVGPPRLELRDRHSRP
eukprot:XP_001704501.1 Hypothetical protein GL50803_121724 [Giardia lamblia ATCC 50803]